MFSKIFSLAAILAVMNVAAAATPSEYATKWLNFSDLYADDTCYCVPNSPGTGGCKISLITSYWLSNRMYNDSSMLPTVIRICKLYMFRFQGCSFGSFCIMYACLCAHFIVFYKSLQQGVSKCSYVKYDCQEYERDHCFIIDFTVNIRPLVLSKCLTR